MESATPEIEKDLHQYEWITMNEAGSHKQLMGKLTSLVKKIYEEVHTANPVRDMG